jgi:hypothetical protein
LLDDSDARGEAGGDAAVDGISAKVDGNLGYSLELKRVQHLAPFSLPWNFS